RLHSQSPLSASGRGRGRGPQIPLTNSVHPVHLLPPEFRLDDAEGFGGELRGGAAGNPGVAGEDLQEGAAEGEDGGPVVADAEVADGDVALQEEIHQLAAHLLRAFVGGLAARTLRQAHDQPAVEANLAELASLLLLGVYLHLEGISDAPL